jgi:hypothetical protein
MTHRLYWLFYEYERLRANGWTRIEAWRAAWHKLRSF